MPIFYQQDQGQNDTQLIIVPIENKLMNYVVFLTAIIFILALGLFLSVGKICHEDSTCQNIMYFISGAISGISFTIIISFIIVLECIIHRTRTGGILRM